MISIEAKDLHRMLQQVTPHMADPDEYLPALACIRVEATDDGWLYAVATDRYTLAVARHETLADTSGIGYLPAQLVPAVTAWLAQAAEHGQAVKLALPTHDQQAIALRAPGSGRLSIETDTNGHKGVPNWRTLLHAQLKAEPVAVPLTGFTTRFLARWQQADLKVHAWQAGPHRPLIVAAESGDFLGLQMPVRSELTQGEATPGWLAATAPRATVDGTTYRLDRSWKDRDGDPWTYSGKDTTDGMPLMVVDGFEEDPHPLDRLIAWYGPLHTDA